MIARNATKRAPNRSGEVTTYVEFVKAIEAAWHWGAPHPHRAEWLAKKDCAHRRSVGAQATPISKLSFLVTRPDEPYHLSGADDEQA